MIYSVLKGQIVKLWRFFEDNNKCWKVSPQSWPQLKLQKWQSSWKLIQSDEYFIYGWVVKICEMLKPIYMKYYAIKMRPTHNNDVSWNRGRRICLTKDPLIASWASQEFLNQLRVIRECGKNKWSDTDYAFNYFKKLLRNASLNKIAILGVPHGPGIGDTRFSPVKKFYEQIRRFVPMLLALIPMLIFGRKFHWSGIRFEWSKKQWIWLYYNCN